MNKEEFKNAPTEKLSLDSRKELTLTGVIAVLSFESDFAELDLADSRLSVEGQELQILKMDVDSGEVVITGRVDGLFYTEKKSVSRTFGRLFGQNKGVRYR